MTTNRIPNSTQTKSIEPIQFLPSAVTGLRLVILPLLIFSLNSNQLFLGASFFLFAIASDIADGRLARKLGVSSQFGARFDACVDFVFIAGSFFYFVIQGLYPVWVLGLVVFMFAQFIVTSAFSKVLYDPLGKYYGGFLYGAIGLAILPLGTLANEVVAILIAGITIVSLISRLLYLVKKSCLEK